MNGRRSVHPIAFLVAAMLILGGLKPVRGQPSEGSFHPEFRPESGRELSPPVVYRPIYECAQAVHVSGFIPHARVKVFANGSELVGEAEPPFGFTDQPVELTRPLKFDESITATQTVEGLTSEHSIQPVKVEHQPIYPGGLPTPKVNRILYECGRVVPVGDLVESVRVKVFDEGTTVIGNQAVAGKWQAIWTDPLVKDHRITAQLFACEHDPSMSLEGPTSSPAVKVLPVPSIPLPAATVRQSDLIVGSDVATVDGLLIGAHVLVYDRGSVVGDGYATSESNWVPLTKRVESPSSVQAIQELCGIKSPALPGVTPIHELPRPVVVSPICAGQQFVIVRNTKVNATVVVTRGSEIVAYGGTAGGDLILGLSGGKKFNPGDQVIARQFTLFTLSLPSTPPVPVDARLRTPGLEIADGEPFFNAEPEEQSIDGPVFPRGRNPGPLFLVHSCCNENLKLRIEQESGAVVAELPLSEIFPGYYSARWDWHSNFSWPVPQGIPIGRYFAVATTSCGEEPVRKPFYVIFNPADVGGPARFSFDETGVWFTAGGNTIRAIPYHLHSDDRRVFQVALNAAQGATDSVAAAQRIVDAEEALFGYDLFYHGNDVIHMLEDETIAQCADDANVLTALLRAMGIPAHPATADAAAETIDDFWNFDTWTEFLAIWSGPPEWRIFHPHQDPAMGPETRSVFGFRDVANKRWNDLVVMGDANWKWNEVADSIVDVSFARPECDEPEQFPMRQIWVRDLCEEGYWPINHWSCGTARMSASGLSIELATAGNRIDWNGVLSGTLRVTNLTDSEFAEPIQLEIVADLPESMRFPDEVLSTQPLDMKIAPRGERVERFRLDLPKTNPVGTTLHLLVRTEDANISVFPLAIRPRVGVHVDGPGTLRVGERGVLKVTIAGTDRTAVANVRLNARAPRGVKLGENAMRRIETLQATDRMAFDLDFTAQSPLDAGQIVVDLETDNGGSTRTYVPIHIAAEEQFAIPTPAMRPER